MGARPPRRRSPTKATPAGGKVGDAAFDRWLERGLKRLYGDVATERVPCELLDLIEQDRGKAKARRSAGTKPKKP